MQDFREKLDEYRIQINEELHNLLSENDTPKVLYKPMAYAVNLGGKRLRPILCKLFCKIFSDKTQKVKPSLNPALAIELLHNFTLVHDDIMDNDSLRRGEETVHEKWDIATGVLAGDGIIGVAYRTLLLDRYERSAEIINIFTDGVIEVCEGQGFDKEFETREVVTEEEYINMIYKKTAALLQVSSKIGACCANASDELISLAGEFGKELGIAFQIQDDYLDISSTEEILGKNYGSDIIEGKKTYLYIKAVSMLKGEVKNRFLEIINNKNCSEEDILEVKKIYEDNGIMSDTKKEIERRIDIAKNLLKSISDRYETGDLENFARVMLDRKY